MLHTSRTEDLYDQHSFKVGHQVSIWPNMEYGHNMVLSYDAEVFLQNIIMS